MTERNYSTIHDYIQNLLNQVILALRREGERRVDTGNAPHWVFESLMRDGLVSRREQENGKLYYSLTLRGLAFAEKVSKGEGKLKWKPKKR